jgi:hypothetical protein
MPRKHVPSFDLALLALLDQWAGLRTGYYPGSVKPARPGWYWVRCIPQAHPNAKHFLTGRNARYFDGRKWCGGWLQDDVSIFGTHPSHFWQGMTINPMDLANAKIPKRLRMALQNRGLL